jgi:hypothetical protein
MNKNCEAYLLSLVGLPMAANPTALASPSQEPFLRIFFDLGFEEIRWLALENGRKGGASP